LRVLAITLVTVAAATAPAAAAQPRVLLTGDSMMAVIEVPVADALRGLGADVVMDSRVGSGITKPFVFDWVATAPAQARLVGPDATVVFLGAGDIYDLRRHGRRARCCGKRWVAAWADRARKMIRSWRDVTPRAPGRVYWLTLPVPRDRGLAKVFAVINRAIRRAVRLAGRRAATIDLTRLVTPGDRRLRERDGVHLSAAGAALAGVAIAKRLTRDAVLSPPAVPARTTAR
jgi:hypothetical protein